MNWHSSDHFAPLMLVMGGQEKYRLVSSLREVAETLIGEWQSEDGEEYMAAVKICLDAIHGKLSAQEARDAPIRAADEAGIPVIRVVH
ncbi:DUF982 domain-containing protein [Rhizobium cauense]|uniref:DUF982 domain-containing protein n=1 Tax=Rhizobium cauense TaxID=1166683 RepID=UPI001C6F4DAE|nr:DUF982 domain-containing protein [Rhizobium cauense]MBW9114042.1 DUF982 domain-containing protein [Rhizobium cauense]